MTLLFMSAYQSYLHSYHQTCQMLRKNYAQQYSAEVMFTDSSWVNLEKNLTRFDLAIRENNNLEFFEVSTDNIQIPLTKIELADNLELEVLPFVWNGIEIICESFNPKFDDFEFWFAKWMDVGELKEADSYGLHGIIHSFSSEQQSESKLQILNVDFGSAPLDSLMELLNLLQRQGNNKLSLSSKWNNKFIHSD